MTTLGREIKKARAERGLMQKDLHMLTGITQKYLSRIENDQADPSFSLVVRIAQTLGMRLDPILSKEFSPS
jgi:transcriptional regulator with XRE-family HTH domain